MLIQDEKEQKINVHESFWSLLPLRKIHEYDSLSQFLSILRPSYFSCPFFIVGIIQKLDAI
jgi:hypothetical protein